MGARFGNAGEVTSAYAKASTAHGVRRAGHAVHCWASVAWTLLFAAGFGGFVFYTVVLVVEYNGYPIKSSSYTEGGLRAFPSVTVCGLNPEPVHSASATVASAAYKAAKIATCESRCKRLKTTDVCGCNNPSYGVAEEGFIDCDPVLDPPKTQCSRHVEKEFDTWRNRTCPACAFSSKAGSASRTILFCAFDGLTCNPVTSFTTSRPSTRYGQCHTFSNHTKITKAGPDNGLSLILDSERLDFVGEAAEGEGFRVVVHPPGVPPNVDVDGMNIPTAMEATISIQEKGRERLGSPYDSCDGAKDASSLNCDSESCTPPCMESHYHKVTSFIDYPTKHHEEALRNLMESVIGTERTHPEFNQLAALKVFYSDLNKDVLAQTPAYTIAKLLTQIGGISALFCGVSILTCCEFGQMLISYASRPTSAMPPQPALNAEEF